MFRKIELRIQKARDYYKTKGFLRFSKHFFEKLGFELFSHSLIFLVLDMKDIPNDHKRPYSFHIAAIKDIQNEPDNYSASGYLLTKKEIIARLKAGHRLFVFKEENKLVYFLWAEQKNAAVDWFRLPLHLPVHMAYISGSFTMPDFRKKGIATKIKKEVFDYLKKEGITKLVCVVHPANTKALFIHKKIGFKEYQSVTYQRYWQIRHYSVQKFNSDERKTYITLFKAPKELWQAFLC